WLLFRGCGSVGLSMLGFFFSSRRRHTRLVSDWSSDVCSSDLISITRPDASEITGTFLAMSGFTVPVTLNSDVAVCDVAGSTRNRSEERRVGKEGRSGWAAWH